MVKLYSEKVDSNFEGTIIDLETIGEFDDRYDDSLKLAPSPFSLRSPSSHPSKKTGEPVRGNGEGEAGREKRGWLSSLPSPC